MSIIYNILIEFSNNILLPILSIFSKKIRRFTYFRKNLINEIKNEIDKTKKYIWVHVASLGEYEMAIPLLKEIKRNFNEDLILTFFSESGFKLEKRIKEVTKTYYLPLDTKKNVKEFISEINPIFAVFIKSEIWPNYISELKKRKIKSYLVNYSYNRITTKLMRGVLNKYEMIYAQDRRTKDKVKKLGINNVELAGNLKFNRAQMQRNEKYENQKLKNYLHGNQCVVFGSTWKNDEEIIIRYINTEKRKKVKYIIAPHQLSKENIERIKRKLNNRFNLYTDDTYNTRNNVLILNTIGVLKYIYKFSDISYIGGGFNKRGLHNIIEACVYGKPIIIGRNYDFFSEARELIEMKGLFSVKNYYQFRDVLNDLLSNDEKRNNINIINSKFIDNNLVSINKIIKSIKNE
tara:strand:+ start:2535 stop:3749 length:1215 start_codon:yes stop_codon:yes gene_type:complete